MIVFQTKYLKYLERKRLKTIWYSLFKNIRWKR